MDELATAGSVAQERLGNIRTVRALGNDSLEVARYQAVKHTETTERHSGRQGRRNIQGVVCRSRGDRAALCDIQGGVSPQYIEVTLCAHARWCVCLRYSHAIANVFKVAKYQALLQVQLTQAFTCHTHKSSSVRLARIPPPFHTTLLLCV